MSWTIGTMTSKLHTIDNCFDCDGKKLNTNNCRSYMDQEGNVWFDPDDRISSSVKNNVFYKQFKGNVDLGEFKIQVEPPANGQKDFFLFKSDGTLPGDTTQKKVIMMQSNKSDGKTSFDMFKNMMMGLEQRVDDKAVEEFINVMKTDKAFFDRFKGMVNK